METRNRPRQPAQPPKQAAYAQASNPVSHSPQEQRAPEAATRHHGDAPIAITRGADSEPSSDEARTRLTEQRKLEQERMRNSHDVDLEYGVEEQPAEGYIADSVKRKGMGMRRAQAGAHAGPVGSAGGPGHPGFGEQSDLAAHMGEKRAAHDRMLEENVGHSPEHEVADREAARQRKLRQNEHVDVAGAVEEASGDPVVTSE